jgi:hypothetical protein
MSAATTPAAPPWLATELPADPAKAQAEIDRLQGDGAFRTSW